MKIIFFLISLYISTSFGIVLPVCNPPCAANEICYRSDNPLSATCVQPAGANCPSCSSPATACFQDERFGQPSPPYCSCPGGEDADHNCQFNPNAPTCPQGCPDGESCAVDINNIQGPGQCVWESLCENQQCWSGSCRPIYDNGNETIQCYCENGGTIVNYCYDFTCSECNNPNEHCANSTDIFGLTTFFCECDPGFQRNGWTWVCEPDAFVFGCSNGVCGPHELCDPFSWNCFCEPGYGRNFSTGACDPLDIPILDVPGYCGGSGDPHMNTYGGNPWDLQVPCDYVYTRGPGFEVQVRHGQCVPQFPISYVACVVGVALIWQGTIFEADRDGFFYVNGTMQTLPFTFGGMTFTSMGSWDYFRVVLPNGVEVNYYSYGVSVVVPPTLQGQINGGVCGTYDAVVGNEWMGRNGNYWFDQHGGFSNEWLVGMDDPQLFRNSNPDCVFKKRSTTPVKMERGIPCTNIPETALCDPIKDYINTPCGRYMDVQRLVSNCILDICIYYFDGALNNDTLNALLLESQQLCSYWNDVIASFTTGTTGTTSTGTTGTTDTTGTTGEAGTTGEESSTTGEESSTTGEQSGTTGEESSTTGEQSGTTGQQTTTGTPSPTTGNPSATTDADTSGSATLSFFASFGVAFFLLF